MFSDLITGGDLFSRLDSGPMTEIEILPIVYQLLKTLEYMHRHGVVHRDLKVLSPLVLAEKSAHFFANSKFAA